MSPELEPASGVVGDMLGDLGSKKTVKMASQAKDAASGASVLTSENGHHAPVNGLPAGLDDEATRRHLPSKESESQAAATQLAQAIFASVLEKNGEKVAAAIPAVEVTPEAEKADEAKAQAEEKISTKTSAPSTPAANKETESRCVETTPEKDIPAEEKAVEKTPFAKVNGDLSSAQEKAEEKTPVAIENGEHSSSLEEVEERTPVAKENEDEGHAAAGLEKTESNPTGDECLQTPSGGKVLELSRRLTSEQAATPAGGLATRTPSSGALASHTGTKAAPTILAVSDHDSKNTINASQLLAMGSFKLVPLKDFVAYDELVKLRLEDGIDPTRKEDYLSEEDFQAVFGFTREEFGKMAAWKKIQKKKQFKLF